MEQLVINVHRVNHRVPKAKSTIVIELLKRWGIPGSMAMRLFTHFSPEYILRKAWLLEYNKDRGYPVIDDRRWLIAAIKNDYNESDDFINWLKRKKEYIIMNGSDDLKQLISI